MFTLIVTQALDLIFFAVRYNFNVMFSLPLNLCDLAWFACLHALLTRQNWSYAICFFMGLTFFVLTTLTPDLNMSFPHIRFFSFFISHACLILTPVYLTAVVGLRPSFKLLGLALIGIIVWAVLAFTVNSWLGSNYFYVTRKPLNFTLLNVFAPWPYYIFEVLLLSVLLWSLLTLGLQLLDARSKRSATE